jgi:hypothetical protein
MNTITGRIHHQHGAFMSELRALGFKTQSRTTAGGYLGHAAVLNLGTRRVIVLPPSNTDPGAVLDYHADHRRMDAKWAVPAVCFSDTVRDVLSGVEVMRMHGPDCVCVHPDAL